MTNPLIAGPRVADTRMTAGGPGGFEELWDGPLGPVWINSDGYGDWGIDDKVSPGLEAFIAAAMTAAGLGYTFGTAYATVLDLSYGIQSGTMHYDGGRYDPHRDTTRVVATWCSEPEMRLANLFIAAPNAHDEHLVNGWRTDRLADDALLQPPNNTVVVFDEGIHMHGRAARRPHRGLGVFMSASLYRPGQVADLHCPRLTDLRTRGEHAIDAACLTTTREYEGA